MPPILARHVLACDLGGSSFRAALVDPSGRILHSAAAPLPTPPDRDGVAECDPAQWWQVLTQTVDRLAADSGARFDDVAAIAISAITRTQVFLGADGRVLRPALLWRDTRAEPVLAELRALLPTADPETREVNAFHPLARLFCLARAEPELFAGLAAVVEPKDFLNARLTGRVAIDTIGSARLLACRPALLAASGLPRAIVPEALAPTDLLGVVQPGLPGALGRLAGAKVVAMAHDTWASVVGLGALRPGFAYNLSGTTEVLGVMSEAPVAAEGLMTVAWGQGLHQIGGPSQTGADSLVWLLHLLGSTADDLGPSLEALLAQPRHPQPVLFLPYLQGERVPYWNPSLRGAFIGLNRRHGPTDLAYAVLEGVGCLNRIVLDRAEAAAGLQVREIRFGGGGAANARWCQIKADITGRDVVVVDAAEPGLLGAAIVAFAALGCFADLAAAQAAMVAPRARFLPRPEMKPCYQALFNQFRAAEQALAPVSAGLAGLALPVMSGQTVPLRAKGD
jgi:xylulokinase